MWLNRLFTRIFLVFALIMIVCVGVSGWFMIRFSENIVTREICDGDRNFAGLIAQEIEAEVARVKPTLTLLAQTPELRLMEATKVSVGVGRVQRGFPEITSVYVADMEGKQIYRTGTGQIENVSGMRSFQVAKAGDKFSSDIYLKPATLEPMQTITLPIIDSGTVVGVLSANVSFVRIMRSFMGVNAGEDGNVIVVADNGRVIAHTHIEQVQGVDLSRLPVVKAVLAGEAGTMKGYTDELGRYVLGTYMPISELGWGVLIQRPLSKMYAEVGQLRAAIIWVMIAIVLLILPTGWLMSRQIARPIGQIAAASKRVAQGDLSTSVDVKSSTEVGLLAHSFNQMVMSLKKAKDELQQWGEDIEQSRNALKESERKYREVVETSVDGVISVDSQMKVGVWNKGAERIFGYTEGEMIGQSLMKIVPERYKKEMEKGFVEFRKSGLGPVIGKTLELQGVSKDGTEVPVELSVSSREINGKHIATAIARDISERKQAEEERAKLQAQLSNAMEMAHLGHWEYDVGNDLFTFNDHFYKIFHTTANQVGGYTMSSAEYARRFVHPDDMRIVEEETRKAIEATDLHFSRQLEHRILYADGAVGHITVRFFIVKDAHGKTVKTYGVNQDITERKRMEGELLRSQKMESIGNLAGGIAHDFNNILSSIIGFTELALDEVEKDTNIEDGLQEVYAAGKRAKDLVKQILAFARQSEEEIKPVRVDTIAKEVLKLIRSSIPTTIEIKQNIESSSLIMGNETQVHQLFMNLCTNAAHAMEDEGGILKVSLKDIVINGSVDMQKIGLKPGNYIQIRVSDTGVGIPPDILGSIFEPYFTTKGPGEGTGMGLAMVHGVVEIYGGKITVDSRLGEGTAFTVYLPITRKRQENRPYKPGDLPSGTERILFVDDELAIAKMGSQNLQRLGYSVTTRTSSVEALELFRTKPNDFDLVITDMTMPNMTGDKLAVELMKIRPNIPVILCTGYSRKVSDESAAAIGIKAFAYKPVIKADLAKTVRKVLDEAKSSAQ